jgi:hypothetical protein
MNFQDMNNEQRLKITSRMAAGLLSPFQFGRLANLIGLEAALAMSDFFPVLDERQMYEVRDKWKNASAQLDEMVKVFAPSETPSGERKSPI